MVWGIDWSACSCVQLLMFLRDVLGSSINVTILLHHLMSRHDGLEHRTFFIIIIIFNCHYGSRSCPLPPTHVSDRWCFGASMQLLIPALCHYMFRNGWIWALFEVPDPALLYHVIWQTWLAATSMKVPIIALFHHCMSQTDDGLKPLLGFPFQLSLANLCLTQMTVWNINRGSCSGLCHKQMINWNIFWGSCSCSLMPS